MTVQLASMTGFARTDPAEAGEPGTIDDWFWELRSVNSRGFELRLKLPSGLEGLEPALREKAGRVLRRGAVQASLTVAPRVRTGLRINRAWLDTLIALARELAEQVPDAPAPRVEMLLGLPGVMQSEAAAGEHIGFPVEMQRAVVDGFGVGLVRLVASRESEGARLGEIVGGLLDQFADLHGRAAAAAAVQVEAHRARLMRSLDELLRGAPSMPEERLAQEVALLATKSDVREELDRLESHLAGARGLLRRGGPVGRDLDFLVQEFGREINTLCSKSGHIGLTGIGLQMKAVMEQVREQVQNLE
jgi:uncharacterized protein (TIGR00255 family)